MESRSQQPGLSMRPTVPDLVVCVVQKYAKFVEKIHTRMIESVRNSWRSTHSLSKVWFFDMDELWRILEDPYKLSEREFEYIFSGLGVFYSHHHLKVVVHPMTYSFNWKRSCCFNLLWYVLQEIPHVFCLYCLTGAFSSTCFAGDEQVAALLGPVGRRFTQDGLQEITHYLCHCYGRCSRAVSIPAPTYWAHHACNRANTYLAKHLAWADLWDILIHYLTISKHCVVLVWKMLSW